MNTNGDQVDAIFSVIYLILRWIKVEKEEELLHITERKRLLINSWHYFCGCCCWGIGRMTSVIGFNNSAHNGIVATLSDPHKFPCKNIINLTQGGRQFFLSPCPPPLAVSVMHHHHRLDPHTATIPSTAYMVDNAIIMAHMLQLHTLRMAAPLKAEFQIWSNSSRTREAAQYRITNRFLANLQQHQMRATRKGERLTIWMWSIYGRTIGKVIIMANG